MIIFKRRTLTPTELTFCAICFNRIEPARLNSKQQDLFTSLASQFSQGQKLSDKQLAALSTLKYASDCSKRSDAIAQGRIPFDDAVRIDAKLNLVYNPIRQK